MVDMLGELEQLGFLNLYFVSLISADTLQSIEDCDKSEAKLLELQEAIPDSQLQDKEKWLERAKDGLEIVRRDRELIKKELKGFKK